MELERYEVGGRRSQLYLTKAVDLFIADIQVAVHVPTYYPQRFDCPHQD